MSRNDYLEIKELVRKYIGTWEKYDTTEIREMVYDDVYFNTSTSLTMEDGAQDSPYGICDFLNDFPRTRGLVYRIYNYVCRIKDHDAYGYAEIPCLAYDNAEEYFEFTVQIAFRCQKRENSWKIAEIRQEIIAERGSLQSLFEKAWYLKNDKEARMPILRGVCESPWINVPVCDDVLTKEEKIQEVLIKAAYGEETNVMEHVYDAYSSDYGEYTYWGTDNSGRKEYVGTLAFERGHRRYAIKPMKFTKIEVDGSRAFVEYDRMRGLKQNVNEYVYTNETLTMEHSCAKCFCELVLEKGQWKIAYQKSYKGLYETGYYEDRGYGSLI